MNSNKETRKRNANYSNEEKITLLNLIAEYKDIIECKKTDAVTWRDKENVWTKITNKFNSVSPNLIMRSKESIKKIYDNKKKEVRNAAANKKQNIMDTGGGAYISSTDPSQNIILDIVNKKTIVGLETKFGGDNVFNNQRIQPENKIINMPNDVILEDLDYTITNIQEDSNDIANGLIVDNNSLNANNTEIKNIEFENDWGNFKATNLKTPKNKKLTLIRNAKDVQTWATRRRPSSVVALHSSHLSKQYSDLATLKLELATLQKEAFISEIETKKERDSIEFELRKKSLELDIEIKQAQLKKLI